MLVDSRIFILLIYFLLKENVFLFACVYMILLFHLGKYLCQRSSLICFMDFLFKNNLKPVQINILAELFSAVHCPNFEIRSAATIKYPFWINMRR